MSYTDGNGKATILIVDDSPDNLTLLGEILKDDYKVKVANNGEKALKLAGAENPPDLILLDIVMPGIDGYEVCRRLKSDKSTAIIPIIFLTARTDVEDEKRGLELGAVDYVFKPISAPIVAARVKTHLQLKAAADFLRDKNAYLEQIVDKRTNEIRALQEVTIFALASLAETRDNETGKHIRRTQLYVKVLADKLRGHPRFQATLTDYYIDLLFKSAPLHDIGKVGIPDRILLKPEVLLPEEFEVMKTHTRLGREALINAERNLDSKMEFLSFAKEITFSHHERWDGKGYPEKLSGEAIPLSARLMALADVYDAIISRRVYKPALTHDEAINIIGKGRGQQFDPDVVDAFIEIQDSFRNISIQFADAN